jgi:squalene synthase HpnC
LARSYSPEEAVLYTRWLATSHYENFRVASLLLPAELHQDFYNVYSYCRWADDLGDEIGDPAESLRLLAWWRQLTVEMFDGKASHPVFVALSDTVHRHSLPIEPFTDLIHAFEIDQSVHSYASIEELLGYCRYSANPVGRLVLGMCGYQDAERRRLSDFTCTGLQLANFWQDVKVDLEKGRVYIPTDVMRRHGYSMERLHRRESNHAFREVMREMVGVARKFLIEGLPLREMVPRRLSVDIELFSLGGLKILDTIEARRYSVLRRRPVVSRWEQLSLLGGAVARGFFRRTA